MSDNVIRVENLSKKYVLGKKGGSDGLRHMIHDFAMAPLRWLRKPATGSDRDGLETRHPEINSPKPPDIFWALKDVSFEVKQGEVVGIIGRNGAGKSTLLKILSRITEQTEGRVEITGRVASLLEVGTGFHPELTGRENIFLNGAILGMGRAEIRKKFDEIVAFAEVEKFLDTPVKRYSSGMYVRLAFAVAAHLEPEILIVDEVLAVGDAAFQKKCMGKMGSVARAGRTILFVSHNMAAVGQLTQRCLLLKDGKVVYSGDTSEAIMQYMQGSHENLMTVFNVENVPRKYVNTLAAKILQLRFNRSVPQFLPDEDFEFIALIHMDKPIERLRLSMTLFSQDGTPIGGSFSADDHTGWSPRQCVEINVVLPCPKLAPGRYYCGVGIGKGNPRTGHVDYDVVLETLQFEVAPQDGEAGTVGHWTHAWGRIIFGETKITVVPVPK
jgi:lipopolysaccharide transport system ATP-binding protein